MCICLLLALSVALLVGCRPTLTATSPTATAVEAAASLPSPQSQPTAMVVPTPGTDTGVVTGQFLVRTEQAPLIGHIVYLAEFVPLEPGPAYTIVFKEQESPHIATDGEARFALAGEPGTYAVVVWTPSNSRVVTDQATAEQAL